MNILSLLERRLRAMSYGESTIGFYGKDRHLVLFKPRNDYGKAAAWGFHLRSRQADGTWEHMILRLHEREQPKPGARGCWRYELVGYRTRNASTVGKGNRLNTKRFVRIKIGLGDKSPQRRYQDLQKRVEKGLEKELVELVEQQTQPYVWGGGHGIAGHPNNMIPVNDLFEELAAPLAGEDPDPGPWYPTEIAQKVLEDSVDLRPLPGSFSAELLDVEPDHITVGEYEMVEEDPPTERNDIGDDGILEPYPLEKSELSEAEIKARLFDLDQTSDEEIAKTRARCREARELVKKEAIRESRLDLYRRT